MRKLTVLVDLDDTLEMLGEAWCEYLNARHGLSVAYEDLNQWDVASVFSTITREQVFAPLLEDEFWEYVKPIDGAVDGLKKVIEDGHKVYIVTTSNYQSLKAKMDKVLFRYFPYLSWSDVIITSNKQMIRGDVLVDDGPHNLVGGSYAKIMMDAPHNRQFIEKDYGILRVKTWDEVYSAICEIAQEGR